MTFPSLVKYDISCCVSWKKCQIKKLYDLRTAELSLYDFSIEYRSGKKNKDADPLSRLWEDSRGETDDDMDKIPFNVVKTVCGEMDSCELKSHLQNVQVSNVDWRNRQLNDTSISRIIQYVESGTKPSVRERRLLPVSIKLLLRSLDKYVMRNGILYRRRMVEEKEHYQLVLPEAYHKEVLHGLHDDMAHLGVDRTTSLVRDRYYWPKMLQDIENHIKICERCIKRDTIGLRCYKILKTTLRFVRDV